MKLLLDTHTFIYWDSNPDQLPSKVANILSDPNCVVFLSVVSVWEMINKSQIGKLNLRLPLSDLIAEKQSNGLQLINITLEHSLAVEQLPLVDHDHFDRMLAAQAMTEDLILVTADTLFENYPIRILW